MRFSEKQKRRALRKRKRRRPNRSKAVKLIITLGTPSQKN